MNNELISVIIPAYNSARYIAETINSVLQQKHQFFELIVVDDGSTDNQNEIIQRFAKQDQRVRLIKQKNLGVAAARNTGIRHAKGNYLSFLDADDLWHTDNLSLKIEKLKNEDIGLVHSDAQVIDQFSNPTGKLICGKKGRLLDDILLWEGPHIPGPSSILIKREVVDNIGMFDHKLSTAADMDFFIRITSKYGVGKLDKVTWQYRVHENNMHQNIAAMEKDVRIIYQKASHLGLFKNRQFEKKCLAKMNLVLGYSWAGDGQNFFKAAKYILQALMIQPSLIQKIGKKIVRYS